MVELVSLGVRIIVVAVLLLFVFVGVWLLRGLSGRKVLFCSVLVGGFWLLLMLIAVQTYPFSNIVVVLVAVFLGTSLGILFKSVKWLLIALWIFAILDFVSFYAPGGQSSSSGPPAPLGSIMVYLNFMIIQNVSKFQIGLGDLLLFGLSASVLLKNAYSKLVAFLAPFVGLFFGPLFMMAMGMQGMPLLPFIALSVTCVVAAMK